MKTHELKILPEYFEPVLTGDKTFELRMDDRNFQVGDILVLKEWDSYKQSFTSRETKRVVKYKYTGKDSFGLSKGFCILALGEVEENRYATK